MYCFVLCCVFPCVFLLFSSCVYVCDLHRRLPCAVLICCCLCRLMVRVIVFYCWCWCVSGAAFAVCFVLWFGCFCCVYNALFARVWFVSFLLFCACPCCVCSLLLLFGLLFLCLLCVCLFRSCVYVCDLHRRLPCAVLICC